MPADLVKILDLKRQVRRIAVTILLLLAGTVATVLALAMTFWALYLWLQLQLGSIAALGIMGGALLLVAGVLFALAFRRANGKMKPDQPSPPANRAADDELLAAAVDLVRRGPRGSAIAMIVLAIAAGWLVGRRKKKR
jgi:hypothetical protein